MGLIKMDLKGTRCSPRFRGASVCPRHDKATLESPPFGLGQVAARPSRDSVGCRASTTSSRDSLGTIWVAVVVVLSSTGIAFAGSPTLTTLASNAGMITSHPTPSGFSGSVMLEQAEASLAAGQGPAGGEPMNCSSTGGGGQLFRRW
jgi:hypothetical protein